MATFPRKMGDFKTLQEAFEAARDFVASAGKVWHNQMGNRIPEENRYGDPFATVHKNLEGWGKTGNNVVIVAANKYGEEDKYFEVSGEWEELRDEIDRLGIPVSRIKLADEELDRAWKRIMDEVARGERAYPGGPRITKEDPKKKTAKREIYYQRIPSKCGTKTAMEEGVILVIKNHTRSKSNPHPKFGWKKGESFFDKYFTKEEYTHEDKKFKVLYPLFKKNGFKPIYT